MATRPNEGERSKRRARILAEALADGRQALRSQAARHARGAADAEEVLQDACVEFLRYYDGEAGEHAIRYLMLAVKHRAWALARRAERESVAAVESMTTDVLKPGKPHLALSCGRPGPADRAERREALREFCAAWSMLKPDQRTVLLLFALGYTYREIAARQGWTYTKVNRCLVEGRAALRACASGKGGESPSAAT